MGKIIATFNVNDALNGKVKKVQAIEEGNMLAYWVLNANDEPCECLNEGNGFMRVDKLVNGNFQWGTYEIHKSNYTNAKQFLELLRTIARFQSVYEAAN